MAIAPDDKRLTRKSEVGQFAAEDIVKDGPLGVQLKNTIGGANSLGAVTAPAGFSFTAPVPYAVYRTGLGNYEMDVDVAALRPAAGVTYYVSPDGLSGNDGLTEAAPTKYPDAVNKADVGTIVFLPGEYFRNNHTPPIITKSLNLIGRPGAILTGYETPSNLAWTLESGSIYKTTRSATLNIVDKRDAYKDSIGDYQQYRQKTDLASVTGPGQWAIVGSTVYVWALGNANLATDSSFLRVNIQANTTCVRVEGANTVYLEGLQLEGGGDGGRGTVNAAAAIGSSARPRLIAVDTTVKYSSGKGFKVDTAEFALFLRCKVQTTGGDGFSYHADLRDGVVLAPNAIEINCTALNNGYLWNSSNTDNGSTTHGGAKVIRVKGSYKGSFGPLLAEDSGGQSWNLGTVAGSSRSPARFWAYCASTNDAQMWLEDAVHYGNPGKVPLYAYGPGSKIHVRRDRPGSLAGLPHAVSPEGIVDNY